MHAKYSREGFACVTAPTDHSEDLSSMFTATAVQHFLLYALYLPAAVRPERRDGPLSRIVYSEAITLPQICLNATQ
jgi:hypothetical protein